MAGKFTLDQTYYLLSHFLDQFEFRLKILIENLDFASATSFRHSPKLKFLMEKVTFNLVTARAPWDSDVTWGVSLVVPPKNNLRPQSD